MMDSTIMPYILTNSHIWKERNIHRKIKQNSGLPEGGVTSEVKCIQGLMARMKSLESH